MQGESTDLPFCWEVVVPICHRNKDAGCGSVSLRVINKIKIIYLPAYIVTLISSWGHFFTLSFPEEHCSACSQVGFLPAAWYGAGCNLCWVSFHKPPAFSALLEADAGCEAPWTRCSVHPQGPWWSWWFWRASLQRGRGIFIFSVPLAKQELGDAV